MKNKLWAIVAAIVVTILPVAALAAGVIEGALKDAQSAAILFVAVTLVGSVLGWLVGRVGQRADLAIVKAPEDRTLTDRLIIEVDRRLDEIDRNHLETVVNNVLTANLDRVMRTIGVPPLSAADTFVDDLFDALAKRNPRLYERTAEYLDRDKAKDLIAAGIGRITSKDALADALSKIPGLAADVRRPGQV